jgi:hypothetical protein
MHVLFRRGGTVMLAVTLLVVAACSDKDEPTAPTTEQVAGSYAATRLTATSPLGTENVLQQGGSLTMEFLPSGELTGTLSAPNQGITNLAFAGTWRIEDGEVEIDQVDADTFVEELSFRVVGNTLVADEIIDVVRVRATLTKR